MLRTLSRPLSALIAFFRSSDEGQGLAEYGLILTLIAIVAIISLIVIGGQVSKMISNVAVVKARIRYRVRYLRPTTVACVTCAS